MYNLKFEKKNIGENPIKIEEIIAVFLSDICFVIRYVNNIIAKLRSNVRILPYNVGLSFIFQIKPSINGQIIGLKGSHNPCCPREKIYFPIPI